MFQRYICILLSVLAISLSSGIATIAQTTETMQIEQEIKRSKIFAPAIKFKLHKFGSNLTISTYRHPLANLTDLKIDTLLVAKACLSVPSAKISHINAYFFNSEDNSKYWSAEIGAKLLQKLQSQSIEKQAALDSVSLTPGLLANPLTNKYSKTTYKEITADNPLSPGMLAEERKALQKRIKELKTSGENVADLEKLFLQLDDAVRLNAQESAVKANYLFVLHQLENKEKKKISARSVEVEND